MDSQHGSISRTGEIPKIVCKNPCILLSDLYKWGTSMNSVRNLDSGCCTHARFRSHARWTIINAGDSSSQDAAMVLQQLCHTYWFLPYATFCCAFLRTLH